jgi:hypothetical protein
MGQDTIIFATHLPMPQVHIFNYGTWGTLQWESTSTFAM